MKTLDCTNCGSRELVYEAGFLTCIYCRSQFAPPGKDHWTSGVADGIGISADIRELLRKCESDPANRRRYANLILDLDPSNHDVQQYLR